MTKDNKELTKKPEPIKLQSMAPKGVDGRAWVAMLKQQLLASGQKEPSDVELVYFAQVAQSSGLDPSKREIYGIYRGGKLTIQTGIDGLRVVAERSGHYAGSKEYELFYSPDRKISVKSMGGDKLVPNSATATVIKVVGDKLVETVRTANWEDYYPGEKLGQMWHKYPGVMLGKCAEAQALRAAFPNTAQLYVEEELYNDDPGLTGNQVMDQAVESIKNAKTIPELQEIVSKLDVDQKKQITELAANKVKELSNG